MHELDKYVAKIPDFPEPGILFMDITTILNDADALKQSIDLVQKELEDIDFDVVVGPESRGFIFSMPICYNLHKPFVPVRKKGKLPRETHSISYDLEYGSSVLEIHKDDIKPGTKVVIIDDLIATGGTNKAIVDLVEGLGAEVVKAVYLMELEDLHGRDKLPNYDIASILKY